MAENKELAVMAESIVNSVTKKVDSLSQLGFKFAPDFSPTNALRASMLMLQDMKDTKGNIVLNSCTPGSIARALFTMLTKSLDASKGQMYFIPYGDKLTCIESYFGSVTRAKRAVPDYVPVVKIIREGDVFEFENDVETGETKVTKHQTSFENLDKPIIGAYTWSYYPNGKKDLVLMTMASIQKSWAQSSNGGLLGKKFPEEAVKRTLLRKACKIMINTDINQATFISSEEEELGIAHEEHIQKAINVEEYATFEEVHDEVPADNPKEAEYKEKADATKKQVRRPKANPEPTPEPAPADPPIQENNEDDEF